MLPLVPAYVIAIGATLGLYLWATVGRGWFSPLTAAALVAPTTTITAVAGQAGFLCAALLVGGFRLAAGRPIAAGILFGLATYKPQMGILVPVALISARLWRTPPPAPPLSRLSCSPARCSASTRGRHGSPTFHAIRGSSRPKAAKFRT
jgi:hypothetical protein